MAIETTYIYSTDHSGLLAWLQANAVPEYFDSVVADETTPSTIYCYVGDVALLKFYYSNSREYLDVTNAAGTTKTIGINSNYGRKIRYGFKCAGGLAIGLYNSESYPLVIGLFITKDSANNTIAIFSGSYLDYQLYHSMYAVAAVDERMAPVTITQYTNAPTSTLVPFVCGNAVGENRYTPNAFYMPTTQYTEQGKIVIDGVSYLSNGAWLLKDEEIGGGASGDYVTPATFNAHANSKQNPHEVSANQIPVETTWASVENVEQAIQTLITSSETLAKSANSTGETIAEGTDLDTLTTPGTYCSPSAARSATLVHSPTSSFGFRLEVKTVIGGRYVQIVYPNWGGLYYIRNYLTAGWTNWYKYNGEEIVPSATETEV